MLKNKIRYISFFYLFALLGGAIFFIPAIFVNRFISAPELWMQIGICIGVSGYILLIKQKIFFPSKKIFCLIIMWMIYHIWRSKGNDDSEMSIMMSVVFFFLSYMILIRMENRKYLFVLCSLWTLILTLWGIGQFMRLLPSYNNSFVVTGPFDNPAGISAALAILLPFSLYRFLQKKYRMMAIVEILLIIFVVILSQARAALLSVFVVLILFFIDFFKRNNIKLSIYCYAFILVISFLLFIILFLAKEDSAKGRLFIWKCSMELIVCKPVLGYGSTGFNANYMNKQASYFLKYPNSEYAIFADNVRHPFNEFLRWMVNYGIIGLCLTLLLIILLLRISKKNRSEEMSAVRLSFFSIGTCAFFSYPFSYPFIRYIIVLFSAFVLATNTPRKGLIVIDGYLAKGIVVLFSFIFFGMTISRVLYEREWCKIAYKSSNGEAFEMLPYYDAFYVHFRYKDLFLYNYASILNVTKKYEKSLQIARECELLWMDYDLQMLMADNYIHLKQYNNAEDHLEKAAAMCPVKFMPLYELVKLYIRMGKNEDAQVLARKILRKKIKIPSSYINRIKYKMQNLESLSNHLQ